jgi:hypothetical protein
MLQHYTLQISARNGGNKRRVVIWWSLQSALSHVCLETALANSHVFAKRVASCSVCQWITWGLFPSLVHCNVLSSLQAWDSTPSRFHWQQWYVFLPNCGFLPHKQARRRTSISRTDFINLSSRSVTQGRLCLGESPKILVALWLCFQ